MKNIIIHHFFMIIIFTSCHHFLSLSTTTTTLNTITANNPLSSDRVIVSSDGKYALGFLEPEKSSRFYIGIWFNKLLPLQQTVVWVANRGRPIPDKSQARFTIHNSNLVLLNASQFHVWSTDLSPSSSGDQNLEALLLDSGNFVLRDKYTKTPTVIWQSFDYPTDSFLPGSKIGLDKRSGRNRILTSWNTSEDPSPGLFSLELDPSGSNQYFLLWNRSMKYWTTGIWNEKYFNNIPEMNVATMNGPRQAGVVDPGRGTNYIFNISNVSNENETTFAYFVNDSRIYTYTVIDVSGQLQVRIWSNTTMQWNLFEIRPNHLCDVYAKCGPFSSCNQNSEPFCDCLHGFKSEQDWSPSRHSGGCIRKTPLNCGNDGVKDIFYPSPNLKLPDLAPSRTKLGSAEECKSSCLKDCSCMACSYERDNCSIWTGNLLNLQKLPQGDNNGKTLYIRLSASEIPPIIRNERRRKLSTPIIVGSTGSVLVIMVFVTLMFFLKQRWNLATVVEGSLVAFRYKDLQTATKNFSEKLGSGGFGSVFKGSLPNSTVVAVKKLESIHQGEKQFRTEVSTIGIVQHVNLVRLHGFCSERIQKLLVYDFMSNGSLDIHLFQGHETKVLDWNIRYQIALGVARGLDYLHEKCRDCIIHCDIKPENILLDSDFCPKVADFGLAKLIGRDFSRVLTTMRGTRGYLAPEWISGIAITAKADVYSYGMMLFEFISGRRNAQASNQDGQFIFFPNRIMSLLAKGDDILAMLDSRLLEGDVNVEELARVCNVAGWCIQDDAMHRPPMSKVVQIFEGLVDVEVPPIPRCVQMFEHNSDEINFFNELSSSQQSKTLP